MRPYSSTNIDAQKLIFNYRLSRARRCVENAFGIMVAKWRLFRKPIIADQENIVKMVRACICLHNLLITKESPHYLNPGLADREDNGIFIPGSWRTQTSKALLDLGRIGSSNYSITASLQRDILKMFFLTPLGSVKFQWNRHF